MNLKRRGAGALTLVLAIGTTLLGASGAAAAPLTAGPSDTIDVPDPVFRKWMNDQLGQPADAPITEAQAASINPNQLYITNPQLKSIEGAKYLKDVEKFWIPYTGVTDLEPLRGMTWLTTLDVSNTKVSDISVVSTLTSLKQITLDGTYVTDLRPTWNLPLSSGGNFFAKTYIDVGQVEAGSRMENPLWLPNGTKPALLSTGQFGTTQVVSDPESPHDWTFQSTPLSSFSSAGVRTTEYPRAQSGGGNPWTIVFRGSIVPATPKPAPLTAQVQDVDHEAGSAVLAGTGQPGATIVVKDSDGEALGQTVVNPDGRWELTVEGLDVGEHKLTVEQLVGGDVTHTANVEVIIELVPLAHPAIAASFGALLLLGWATVRRQRRQLA